MKQFFFRHWLTLIVAFILIWIGATLYFFISKETPISPKTEQIRLQEDKWKAQNVDNYRIQVKASYPMPGGGTVYEVVVRDGKVAEQLCIDGCVFVKEGYTVPKLFQVARDTPTECDKYDPKGCLELKYDAIYGYPTLIHRDPGCCDRFFILTVLSFEVLK